MEKIAIIISPTAGTVDLLTDDGDTETGYWLGREVPSSAAHRLDLYQERATERILAEVEGAEVVWDSAQVRTSAVEELDMEDGDARELVEAILGEVLVEAAEAEVAAAPVEVTVEVAGYTVTVEGESVSISRDGVSVGEGRWTGERVEDCGARLGETEDESERTYDEIDDAISEAIATA